MGFFVGGNFGFVLQGISDIVEAFEQNFLARRGNLEFQNQAVLVGDDLVRQIHGQRIAFFFFRALEKFLHLIFGERRGDSSWHAFL